MFHLLQTNVAAVADTLNNAVTTAGETVAKEETSLFSIIFSGGIIGQTIMTIIFIMLFFTIYLYLERLFTIRNFTKSDDNFMAQIKMLLSQGKVDNARRSEEHTSELQSRP